MGELDEKEVAPNTDSSPTTEVANDEPKETEKLLDKKDETEKKVETPKSPSSVTAEIEKLPQADTKRTEEIINIPDTDATPKSMVTQEGREVKPKKIPIGGIKMPGFFTKSKPKGEGDGADGELLDNVGNEAKVADSGEQQPPAAKPAPEKPARQSFFSSLRIRNPFAKRQPLKNEDDENKDGKFSIDTKLKTIY